MSGSTHSRHSPAYVFLAGIILLSGCAGGAGAQSPSQPAAVASPAGAISAGPSDSSPAPVALAATARPAETLSPAAAAFTKAMPVLISRTRHWKGNTNAPVTMLEFSDFQ